MFKATKRTLTAGAVIAVALAPSTAYARFELNPPRAATASVQTRTSISPLVLAAESPATLRRDANLGPRENANPITAAAAIKKQAEQIAAAQAAPAGRAGQTSVTTFQWGDAGIGAAAMFLLLSAVGLFAIASRWHHGATAS
jgi:hypothetical protein